MLQITETEIYLEILKDTERYPFTIKLPTESESEKSPSAFNYFPYLTADPSTGSFNCIIPSPLAKSNLIVIDTSVREDI